MNLVLLILLAEGAEVLFVYTDPLEMDISGRRCATRPQQKTSKNICFPEINIEKGVLRFLLLLRLLSLMARESVGFPACSYPHVSRPVCLELLGVKYSRLGPIVRPPGSLSQPFWYCSRTPRTSSCALSQQNKKTKSEQQTTTGEREREPAFRPACAISLWSQRERVLNTMPIILPKTKQVKSILTARIHHRVERDQSLHNMRTGCLFYSKAMPRKASLSFWMWTRHANSKRLANVMIDFGKGALEACFIWRLSRNSASWKKILSCAKRSELYLSNPRKFKRASQEVMTKECSWIL